MFPVFSYVFLLAFFLKTCLCFCLFFGAETAAQVRPDDVITGASQCTGTLAGYAEVYGQQTADVFQGLAVNRLALKMSIGTGA